MNKRLHITTAIIDDDIVWAVSKEAEDLLAYSIGTMKISRVAPLKASNGISEYNSIVKIEQNLYIIPQYISEYIDVYDTKENKMRCIYFSNEYKNKNFCGNLVAGKFIFRFCVLEPIVMRIDIQKHKIDYIELIYDTDKTLERVLGAYAVVNNKSIIFTLRNRNYIVKMNIDDLKYELHEIKETTDTYLGIEYDDDDHYICTPEHAGKPILVLDKYYRVIKKIDTRAMNDVPIGIICKKNMKWLPTLCKDLCVNNSDFKVIDCGPTVNKSKDGIVLYKKDGTILLITTEGTIINPSIRLSLSSNEIKRLFNVEIAQETEMVNLNDYICMINKLKDI